MNNILSKNADGHGTHKAVIIPILESRNESTSNDEETAGEGFLTLAVDVAKEQIRELCLGQKEA